MKFDPTIHFHKKFGRLTILEDWYRGRQGRVYYKVICDCGESEPFYIKWNSLQSGTTKSCGCFRKEVVREKHFTHGYCGSRLYCIWNSMICRTTNKNNKRFNDYGGRGITVCDEWYDFHNFKEWALANGYRDNLTIERINNDKGYYPENCRWVSYLEQSHNKRVRNDSRSGIKGVHKRNKKYGAYITHHGKQVRLGSFENLDDAIKARKEAEEYYWGK